jgi:hypothetical protein
VARLTSPNHSPTWWLWGVDLQLDNRFDRGQRDYFRSQADRLQKGDMVILCSPIPTWAHVRREPTAFDVLSDFVDAEVTKRDARVVMHLSGDSHHFARYERQRPGLGDRTVEASDNADLHPVQHVTAGGGGAFTHPTHHLDETIDLPVPYDGGATTLRLTSSTGSGKAAPRPDFACSRRLVLSNLWPPYNFIRQNRGFLIVPGMVTAVAAYGAVFGGQRLGSPLVTATKRHVAGNVVANPVGLALIVLLVVGWTAFAKPNRGGSRPVARLVGLIHGTIHVTAVIVSVWASAHLVALLHHHAVRPVRTALGYYAHIGTATGHTRLAPWFVGLLDRGALVAVAAALGGILGAMILAVYLVATNLFLKMHDNEAASAVASTAYKHFVRIHIDGDSAEVWVLHVPDTRHISDRFSAHDPRPNQQASTAHDPQTRPDDITTAQPFHVELWDTFKIGKKRKPQPTPPPQ